MMTHVTEKIKLKGCGIVGFAIFRIMVQRGFIDQLQLESRSLKVVENDDTSADIGVDVNVSVGVGYWYRWSYRCYTDDKCRE